MDVPMNQGKLLSILLVGVNLCIGCNEDAAVLPGQGGTQTDSTGGSAGPMTMTGGVTTTGGVATTGGSTLTTGGADPAPMADAGIDAKIDGGANPRESADSAVTSGPHDYENETVELTSDLVVEAGETLRIGPGTTLQAAAGVSIIVHGTLIIEGSEQAPVSVDGTGVPRSWEGIVIEDGGTLIARNVQIGGATYGIRAMPGSDFTVEDADIGTSFKAAVVESDGTFSRVAFHASGDPAFSISSVAPITDPNGTLTIIGGSPVITNSTFDHGAALVDMIRVRGESKARFEHLHITDAHCGIHSEDGINTAPIIRDCIFENLAYGIMAYSTAPDVQGSVFLNNSADVGFCLGATADNAPSLLGNYYSGGTPTLDAPCAQIGTADASAAPTPNPNAGPIE